MTTPAELMRRVTTRIRQRDPEGEAARRAFRAAIFIPIAAALGFAVAGDTQTPLFALVGSIALLIAADFPGTAATRAMAYAILAVVGTVLITVATLAAPHPLVAVPLCFVVGALVVFLGLLSDVVAAGQRATLMTFILPVCIRPPGPLGDRLFGWFIALAVCIPAALVFLPPRHHSELRRCSARVCSAIAGRIDGSTPATELTEAMSALQKAFLDNAFRPVALTAGSRALIRVIPNLQWLSDRVDSETARLLGPMAESGARLLRCCADALSRPERGGASAELNAAYAEHRATSMRRYHQNIEDILAEPDDASAVELGRMLFSRRIMSAAIGLTGSSIAYAAEADGRPVWAKLLGLRLPETGVADQVPTKRSAFAALGGYLSTRSITVLNSLRTGLALALAVTVTFVFPVPNAPWVVLGALSVLRSSAATTGTTAVRAVTGTTVGIVIGALVIGVFGVDPPVLWTLLPVVAFGSSYVSRVGSFTAGQAMFTMMVLIVFNLMSPIGWTIGFARLEDILVGASVGLMVSVLLWPRGGAAAVQRAIDDALAVGSRYLTAAVNRVTRGASEQANDAVIALHRETLVAVRTYGDAVRDYLSENGGAIDTAMLDTTNRIPRLRTAGDHITDIVPPPLGTYPQARRVLERHTAAMCARLEGGPAGTPLSAISDEFIPALRADAGTGELAAAAALPLVTAAANVGELEVLYPALSAEPATL
ncbi:MAG: FUSC family protein [Mycobacterium sp.]|nr:FUSC family protein [Mycobacterium sp.]